MLMRIYVALLLVFLGVGVVGCQRQNPEQELRKRVELYWQYRAAAQADMMYDMEYPVLKAQMDKNAYIRRAAPVIKYSKPAIQEIAIDKDGITADVRIAVIVGVRPPGAKNTFEQPFTIPDRWVMADDGTWYHVPKSHWDKGSKS
jgi:hypothetical protein